MRGRPPATENTEITETPRSLKSLCSLCSLWLVVLVAAAGCASPPARAARDPLEKPLEARGGAVVLLHGIWPDGRWYEEAEPAFRAAGLETVPVHYSTFLVGYMFGFGTDDPADRLARFVRAAEARHARLSCPAPLRWHTVGFSGGTVAALKAAWRGVRFETAHFGGSPIPCFSPALTSAVREGKIGAVKNYWSLFDGVTGWGWGMGQFAYHGEADDGKPLPIENVPLAYYHLFPPFDGELSGRIAREIQDAARASKAPAHRCFADPDFNAWWRRQTDRLSRGEAIDGEDARDARVNP